MCPLKSKTLRGIVPESSFDIAGTLQILPPAILTIFSGAGYCGHRLHPKQRHLMLFSFVIRSLFELERDDFSSNRHPALSFCLSMILSENRYPLFRITP
jgi:hypothetical protein